MDRAPDGFIEGIDITPSHLKQISYLDREFFLSSERRKRVEYIADELGLMNSSCRLSVCIPAYREAGIITNTLEHYTVSQKGADGTPFDPSVFEINILVNRPNTASERDTAMLEEIQTFKKNHPEYRINTAEVTYNFEKKPVIGLIFKDIVDATILRNLSRYTSEKEKSRLIVRTAGADVEGLNPYLISRTLRAFSDPRVLAHRGETRLPPELLHSFPLLHVIQTLGVFLLRQYHGSHTTNGPFSYTAEAYASVGGFNAEKVLGEEIDLAKRIWMEAQSSSSGERFTRDCVKEVLNNPRRQVHALLEGSKMAGRYQNFGQRENEESVRSLSLSWRNLNPEILPETCTLTPENLSREVSAYYRTYIRIALGAGKPTESIDPLFTKGFRWSGIRDYTIHRSDIPQENGITIGDIDPLLEQMKQQTFSWRKSFGKYNGSIGASKGV